MKARAQMNTAAFVVCLLTPIAMAFSEEPTWVFNSIYGQPLRIDYDPGEGRYAFTSSDVTQRVLPCKNEGMRICISSNYLDISIPEEQPKVGGSWGTAETTFSLVVVIDALEILDKRYEDILVIETNKDLNATFGVPGTRSYRLFYSYQDGLIAFQHQVDQLSGPIFLASRLPSLGAQ